MRLAVKSWGRAAVTRTCEDFGWQAGGMGTGSSTSFFFFFFFGKGGTTVRWTSGEVAEADG